MEWLASLASLLNLIGSGVGTWSSWKQNASQAELDALSAAQLQENTLQSYQAMFINAFGSLSDAEAQANGLRGTIRGNRLQLKQTGANISAYNQAQARMQSQFDYGLASMKAQGKAQFNALLAAYGNSSVANAARGQGSGSASLIEKMAKSSVAEYVGSDMKLDANGGLYGYSLTDYFLDSLASHKEMQGNKEIEEESFDIYYETLQQNMTNLEQAEQNKDIAVGIMKDAYGKMAGFYGEELDAAQKAYQAEYDRVVGLMQAWDSSNASYEDAQALLNSWEKLKSLYASYEELQLKQDEAMAPFNQEWLKEYLGDDLYQSSWGDTGDLFNDLSSKFDGSFGNELRGVQAPKIEEEEPTIDPNAGFTGTRVETINGQKTDKHYTDGVMDYEIFYNEDGTTTRKDYQYKTNDQVDKVTITNPDGSVKEENYWSNGNLESTKTENADGTVVKEQYKDGVLKETSTTDASGITTTEKYRDDGTVGNVTVEKPFVPPAEPVVQPESDKPVAEPPAAEQPPAESPKDERNWWQKFTDWLGITNNQGKETSSSTSSSSSSASSSSEANGQKDSYYVYEDNEAVEEDQAYAHFTGTRTSTVNGVTTTTIYRDGEIISTTIVYEDGKKEKDVVTAKDKQNSKKNPTEERM